jgi:trans-2,3-dihydro-3-hydroxyanthranilate isomerase
VAAHRFTLLDVFAARRLEGNQLAVVHDADDVPDEVMHRFARETKLSETSFVQSPTREPATYRHRIWMMSGEIPFAGHPSLGTAAAVARARGEERATYVQETRPGLQPVDVEMRGDVARVSMLQEPPVLGPELDPAAVLPMVGLEAADADPDLPVQVVSTGAPQVLAQVRDAAALAALRPDYEAIGALLAAHEAIVLYVSAVEPAEGTARARSFLSTAEKGEDPATGAAAGPLLVHVAERAGTARLEIIQGVEMGRPSLLRAELEGARVRVGGDAIVVIDGTVHLDA